MHATHEDVIPVPGADEVYLSMNPATAAGSDVGMTACHYDAPFSWVPQGGNLFVRVFLGVNENRDVITQVGNRNFTLSTSEFLVIDLSRDLHCVHGRIPEGRNRVVLKLH